MSCLSDSDCNNVGDCIEMLCYCKPLFRGDNCQISFADVTGFMPIFWTMTTIALLGQVLLLIGISFTMYHLKRTESLKPVNTFILVSCWIGSLARFLYYAIDPHQVHQIFPPWLDGTLFALALIFWTEGFLFMLVQWADVAKSGGFKKREILSPRGRIIFIVISICLGVLQLVFALYDSLQRSFLSLLLYDIVMVFSFGLLFIGSIFLMIKFRKLLASLKDLGEGIRRFSNRLSRSIALTDISLAVGCVFLIVSAFDSNIPLAYVLQHILFRVCEILSVTGVALFLYVPSAPINSKDGSSANRSVIKVRSKSDTSQSDHTSPKYSHGTKSQDEDDSRRYTPESSRQVAPPSTNTTTTTNTTTQISKQQKQDEEETEQSEIDTSRHVNNANNNTKNDVEIVEMKTETV